MVDSEGGRRAHFLMHTQSEKALSSDLKCMSEIHAFAYKNPKPCLSLTHPLAARINTADS